MEICPSTIRTGYCSFLEDLAELRPDSWGESVSSVGVGESGSPAHLPVVQWTQEEQDTRVMWSRSLLGVLLLVILATLVTASKSSQEEELAR